VDNFLATVDKSACGYLCGKPVDNSRNLWIKGRGQGLGVCKCYGTHPDTK
tara:strand:+ start:491 stop:640 length:150 start_codon:yes stop_codon:yes gene_type:complete